MPFALAVSDSWARSQAPLKTRPDSAQVACLETARRPGPPASYTPVAVSRLPGGAQGLFHVAQLLCESCGTLAQQEQPARFQVVEPTCAGQGQRFLKVRSGGDDVTLAPEGLSAAQAAPCLDAGLPSRLGALHGHLSRRLRPHVIAAPAGKQGLADTHFGLLLQVQPSSQRFQLIQVALLGVAPAEQVIDLLPGEQQCAPLAALSFQA